MLADEHFLSPTRGPMSVVRSQRRICCLHVDLDLARISVVRTKVTRLQERASANHDLASLVQRSVLGWGLLEDLIQIGATVSSWGIVQVPSTNSPCPLAPRHFGLDLQQPDPVYRPA